MRFYPLALTALVLGAFAAPSVNGTLMAPERATPKAGAPEAGNGGDLGGEFSAKISSILNSVKDLAEKAVVEIDKIAQAENIELNDLVSPPTIKLVSSKKRSNALERREMDLLPLIKRVSKTVLQGASVVSDVACIPLLGTVLRGIAMII